MTNYYNYFLTSKDSRLINGHLKSEDLYKKILDHDGSTAYCCYFDLDFSKLKLEWDTGKIASDGKKIYEYTFDNQAPSDESFKCNGKTFAQYEGICKPSLNMVSFDFDAEDPEDSLNDVRKFVEWLEVDDIAVFFSGSKGFHIMIPWGYFPMEASEYLPNQLKDMAKILKETYPTLDTSIYNYNRKFRVPFSKHEKSGLFKNYFHVSDFIPQDGETEEDLLSMQDFLKQSEMKNEYNFLKDIKPNIPREPLKIFEELFEQAKRKSYEIEKHRAGTIDKPSPFERFDNKLCIKKMLESTCEDVGRNNAAIRIANDFFRTGKPQGQCEKAMHIWANNNGLPIYEVNSIISNIYNKMGNYNFGCQDEIKSTYCSAKCEIWKKLDPDKRPVTIDSPSDQSSIKHEFSGVKWLMKHIFRSNWDELNEKFQEGLIVKQGAKDLFYYKDAHWQYLDESKVHILKTKLNAAHGNKLAIRKLDSIWQLFKMYAPEKPDDVDLFSPRNDTANFLDGTLHLKVIGDKYQLVFKEHDKNDFCTNIIEHNYKDFALDKDRKNLKFEKWLMEYLGDDDEAFMLLQEMFGASIMPKFAQIFFLLGKSGTGKSTTIKIMKKLHKNEKNICGVSPDKFHGFHMSSMIGKLLNIVNDIKVNAKIDDDVVKQIDDQEPVRIEVKSREDVYTKIPALHIFGANRLPSTMEGYSGAMGRRVSIVNFDKQYTGKINHNIANDLFDYDPLGVLAFAMRGLIRLTEVNHGNYSKSSRSQSNVKEWTKADDVIATFLGELTDEGLDFEDGPVVLKLNDGGHITRSDLWRVFKRWQGDALAKNNQIGKMQFFNMMKNSGYSPYKSDGNFVFRGIRRVEGDDDSI